MIIGEAVLYINCDKVESYYKLLAEKASRGDKGAEEELINAFTFRAVSLQRFEDADKIAEESGMTQEEQREYVISALEPMNNMPEMKSNVLKIKEHYKLK